MRKKIIGILICMLFFGTSVLPNISGNNINSDESDQSQTKISYAMFIIDGSIIDHYQEFKPTLNTLTRVELYIENLMPNNKDLRVCITSSINGSHLTCITIPPSSIPYQIPMWFNFDFPDIPVIPGNSYFIKIDSDQTPENQGWDLYGGTGDPYPNGKFWHYNTVTGELEWSANGDCCFKTYGYNQNTNNPPNKPSIYYNRITNELVMKAIDGEEDKIRYGVSWANNMTVDVWTSYYNSGFEVRISCEEKKGRAGVIAEDEYGAQSDWASVKLKDKSIEYLFINWFYNAYIQHFSFFEKKLNQYYY